MPTMAQGQIRWKTKTFGIPIENNYGYGSQSYAVAYGHLLLLNISGNSDRDRSGTPEFSW